MAFYDRTEALIGSEGVEKLRRARVLVCGLGGVGGYIVEALARAGVGTIGLLDCDAVEESSCSSTGTGWRRATSTVRLSPPEKLWANARRKRQRKGCFPSIPIAAS